MAKTYMEKKKLMNECLTQLRITKEITKEIAGEAIGQRIKELRTDKGISQHTLALEIHYAQSVVCDWENGKADPSATAIIAISDYFNVSCDYLLGKEDL